MTTLQHRTTRLLSVQPARVACLVILLAGCHDAFQNHPLPYKSIDHFLGVWDGYSYRPIFVKGVNLGTGVPGTRPGELAAFRPDYLRWFKQMTDNGINVLRVYTLHHPRFYKAVFEYNNWRPHKPLYIVHGVWLDEQFEHDPDEFNPYHQTEHFEEGMREVLDAVHGNAEIQHRLGRAFGTYDIDISPWVMGYIIGREMYGAEALTANRTHPDETEYRGEAFSLPEGTPAEVWAAARMDYLVTYEREHYGTERPVAFSSWPTLDPLRHETEPHYGHLLELTSAFDAGEDDATVDLGNLDASKAPAGYFASFHAYPYYPNFISEDPGFQAVHDYLGPNSYYGYLIALKEHYGTLPVMISEFGTPSSWGNAHFAHSGMHHGGHTEEAKGEWDARLLRNVYDSGCAGGMMFAWIDEWWKATWVLSRRAFPRKRFHLWHDVNSPEQNYGLVAFDVDPPDFEQWPAATGPGRVAEVRAAQTIRFFYLRVKLTQPLADGEQLVVGYDTYRDDLGESLLPGTKTPANRRSEFAVVVTAPSQAQVYVTRAYDLFGSWHGVSEPEQMFQSTATDGEPWNKQRWITDDKHSSDDGTYVFPRTTFELGKLRIRHETDPADEHDAVILGDTVEIRIPWTNLQFADPSTRSVVHDERTTYEEVESTISEGIGVVVVLGEDRVETDRFRWDPWDNVPLSVERDKPALKIFAEMVDTLPEYMD